MDRGHRWRNLFRGIVQPLGRRTRRSWESETAEGQKNGGAKSPALSPLHFPPAPATQCAGLFSRLVPGPWSPLRATSTRSSTAPRRGGPPSSRSRPRIRPKSFCCQRSRTGYPLAGGGPENFNSGQSIRTVTAKFSRLKRPTASVPSANGRAHTSRGPSRLHMSGRPAQGVLIHGQHFAVGHERLREGVHDRQIAAQEQRHGQQAPEAHLGNLLVGLQVGAVHRRDPAHLAHNQRIQVVPMSRAGVLLMSVLGEADSDTRAQVSVMSSVVRQQLAPTLSPHSQTFSLPYWQRL